MKNTAILWGDEEQPYQSQNTLTKLVNHYILSSLWFHFSKVMYKEMAGLFVILWFGKQCDLLFAEAQPRPMPSNAVSAKPSIAVVSSVTLLILVSACVWLSPQKNKLYTQSKNCYFSTIVLPLCRVHWIKTDVSSTCLFCLTLYWHIYLNIKQVTHILCWASSIIETFIETLLQFSSILFAWCFKK